MSDFERLNLEGCQLTGHSIRGLTRRAYYGSGFGEGVVVGSREGLKTWKLKCGALPDVEGEYLIDAGEFGLQTRFRYLYDFFVRHNVENAGKPFEVFDPVSRRLYLAEFVEDELDFDVFCLTVFGAGLTLRQRRVAGVESPGGETEVENNAEI